LLRQGDSGAERLRRLIVRRLLEDRKRFEGIMPAEYRRLTELLEDPDPGVRLVSGDFHRFRRDELEALSRDLPWYLRGLVRLPWVFVYQRVGFKHVYRLKAPDQWAARALNYLFVGDVAGEKWEVDAWSFPRLLRRYKSLILVVLYIGLPGEESQGAAGPL